MDCSNKSLLIVLSLLIFCVLRSNAPICSASVPYSVSTVVDQCSFNGATNTYTRGVAAGPISNSLYFLYWIGISASQYGIVRKVDTSGSLVWMASFVFQPVLKSLSVDLIEQKAYLASFTSPLAVLSLSASTGAIINQQQL